MQFGNERVLYESKEILVGNLGGKKWLIIVENAIVWTGKSRERFCKVQEKFCVFAQIAIR